MAGVKAIAQEDPRQIIEGRIANFRDIGSAFKTIGDELGSSRPNFSIMTSSAKVIRDYSIHVQSWFPPGTEPPAKPSRSWLDWIAGRFSPESAPLLVGEVATQAKTEIWTQPERFAQAARLFETESHGFWQTVRQGDIPETRAGLRKLEASCKGCHDVFREED